MFQFITLFVMWILRVEYSLSKRNKIRSRKKHDRVLHHIHPAYFSLTLCVSPLPGRVATRKSVFRHININASIIMYSMYCLYTQAHTHTISFPISNFRHRTFSDSDFVEQCFNCSTLNIDLQSSIHNSDYKRKHLAGNSLFACTLHTSIFFRCSMLLSLLFSSFSLLFDEIFVYIFHPLHATSIQIEKHVSFNIVQSLDDRFLVVFPSFGDKFGLHEVEKIERRKKLIQFVSTLCNCFLPSASRFHVSALYFYFNFFPFVPYAIVVTMLLLWFLLPLLFTFFNSVHFSPLKRFFVVAFFLIRTHTNTQSY